MELKMRQIWATVLHLPVEEIGRADGFMEVGGDSISAIEVVKQARESGVDVSVQDIFKDSRLEAVAATARSVLEGQGLERKQLEPFGLLDKQLHETILQQAFTQLEGGDSTIIENAFPVTPLQEGLMALSIKQPGSYIAKWVYRLSSGIELGRFTAVWDQTVRLCTNLRTRIIQASDKTLQVHINSDIEWERTGGLKLVEFLQSASRVRMTFGSRLNRWALVSNEGEHHFVLLAHHAAYDGWTLRLVLRTLCSLYEGVPNPRLVPFDGFIQHISVIASEASMQKYWHNQLKGANKTSFPPKPTKKHDTSPDNRKLSHTISLPKLREGCSTTLATIIRAAWAMILARYGETDDVCFGTSVSGRQAAIPGITEMPGPVVATLPIRIQIDPDQQVSDFLRQVQSQATDMIPYEQYGLQNISKLGPEFQNACDFSSLLVV